ncbi:rod shape-determining protein MreC [Desulfocurvibacter africanus PCS]|uniref:Cell shape-determining protein MreC n=1 Tax=Desulfocurvibacter africanus PCS TaxID=1262666 RepID=M5PQ04_DESAF|nr:rod shape-determining protein MreC [Desulfocurvibacter africanus]EMG36040.1 rod shape-determining protein MreC [Desulfocurvibacter africanus PCS]
MRAGFVSRRIFLLLLIALFLYLSLYTWNLRYGYLDRLSEITGLEIAGTLLRPGNWVADEVSLRWRRYVHLVDVEQENERLRTALARMALDMARLREDSAKAKRLEHILEFKPPEQWQRQGARVIAHRLGPIGTLETFLVDKGSGDGIYDDAPAITADGAVGRILRVSPNNATVLLLSDPNSRIPVQGRDSRTTGVLMGHGQGEPLSVNYVPLNEPIEVGEILVSSGLARVFPKGVPVARVVTVERSDISLFKTVLAEPLVDVRNLEEVLLLTRQVVAEPETGVAEAVAPLTPSAKGGSAGISQPQGAKPHNAQSQKPAVAQPQTTHKQAEQNPPATQKRATPATQTKSVKPQADQASKPQGAQTNVSPAALTRNAQDSQAPKPQAAPSSRLQDAQVRNPLPPKTVEHSAQAAQERTPLVREAASKPQAATSQPQAQSNPAQPVPAQAASKEVKTAPVARIPAPEATTGPTGNPQPSASTQQPEPKADQAATPATQIISTPEAQPKDMTGQTAPAQAQERARQSDDKVEGSTAQSTWPPALQSPPVSAPTRPQPAPVSPSEPAEQP